MIVDTEQLLTHEQLAQLKGLPSNLLAYYLKKEGAPKAILVLGKKGYLKAEAEAWCIGRDSRGPKPSRTTEQRGMQSDRALNNNNKEDEK